MTLLDEPERLRAALSPLRRELLERLREPASATEVAKAMGIPRQRVNYHLRELESAGLLELVEERPRRGFTERVLRTRQGAFVVDPSVMSASFVRMRDQYAAEHLVDVASDAVRDVARMASATGESGRRLLTFTVEAEVRFASPADVHQFTDDLTDALRSVIAKFDSPGGRRYRLVAGGYPTPRGATS